MNNATVSPLLRLSAMLLLLGQILYVLVTLLHTGGPANDHPVIFAAYAGSSSWAAVHVAQFACMALLIAGLLALAFALDVEAGPATWLGRMGAASAVVALALEGDLQAVDGVANKQADIAWVTAADAEKARGLLAPRQSGGLSGGCGATRPSLSASPSCCSRPRSCG